ncbi:MAG: hypothetical protein EA401_09975 [Planctomycetota bacterium]|nr:MAG: hypothetical protein EA401_09975 [Planctomycetota bacterium]
MSFSLSKDGRICAKAVAAHTADTSVLDILAAADDSDAAAAAIICGRDRYTAAKDHLIAKLDHDGLPGRCAAWALGQMGASEELLAAAADGGLDRRENAYFGLACLVAAQQHPSDLGATIAHRIDDELARAQSGRSGLSEHASRILVMLADPHSEAMIQRIIEGDPLTDRYELQRQRKALADHGRDQESLATLAEWHTAFAEDTATADDDMGVQGEGGSGNDISPETALAPEPPIQDSNAAEDSLEQMGEDERPQAPPIDVQAYIESKGEGAAEDPMLGLLPQVLPMFEQLAQQAVGAQLETLSGQEFAALILQVLPQALPQQYLQALFSPNAINTLAGLFKWYEQQGGNPGLAQGIAIVRQQLQEQVRSSGVLGGPDFSDPDDQDDTATPPLA